MTPFWRSQAFFDIAMVLTLVLAFLVVLLTDPLDADLRLAAFICAVILGMMGVINWLVDGGEDDQ